MNRLYDAICYTGQIREARQLALDEKLESAERLSFMTDEEVCSLLETEFIYIQRTS